MDNPPLKRIKHENSMAAYTERARKYNEEFDRAKQKFKRIVEDKVNDIIRDDPLFRGTELDYDDYGHIHLRNSNSRNIESYSLSSHNMPNESYPETIVLSLYNWPLVIYPNEKELEKQIKDYEQCARLFENLSKTVETAITLVKKYDIINRSTEIWNDEMYKELK